MLALMVAAACDPPAAGGHGAAAPPVPDPPGQRTESPAKVRPSAEPARTSGRCDEHNVSGCRTLAERALRAGRRRKALSLLVRGCDGEDAQSCYELARAYEHRDRPGDLARVREYDARACANDHAAACDALGH